MVQIFMEGIQFWEKSGGFRKKERYERFKGGLDISIWWWLIFEPKKEKEKFWQFGGDLTKKNGSH